MKFLMLGLTAASLMAAPALAAGWTMQPAQSTLGFSGVQTGSPFTGTFTQWSAKISYDPASLATAQVTITINTASAKTGDTQRDSAMPDGDWFDSAAFPTAVFQATGFTAEGGDKFQTSGTLTIRGISQKVTLPFTLDVSGNQAVAKGQLTLLRTSYGVGQGNWSTGDWVALNAGVNFTLTAAKQ
jgi:polyisoprenoid-binding protein YceI